MMEEGGGERCSIVQVLGATAAFDRRLEIRAIVRLGSPIAGAFLPL